MLTLMTKINTQFKSTIMTGLIIILVLALAAVGVLVVMLLRARENGARMQEQVRILGEEQRRLKADSRLVFKDVAQQLLSEQSRAMREQNDVRMGEIVKPLRENLESLKRTIDGYKTEQVSYAAALKQQIKDLSDMNRNIGQEAKELTLALRGDSKVQGDWGEMMLKQILDMSGLQEGVNYETQMTREADGRFATASRKKVGFAEKKLRLTNSWWGQLKFCNSVTKVTAIVVALLVSWCEITLPP